MQKALNPGSEQLELFFKELSKSQGMEKKPHECVLLYVPLYIFVSEKARKKTVHRVSITALGVRRFCPLK